MRLLLPVLLLGAGSACNALFDDTPELPELEDPCAAWPEAGWYRMTIQMDGYKRRPYVHVPALTSGPRAGLVMLHGAASTGPRAATFTRFRELSDKHGFVSIFPNGSGAVTAYTWNAGSCCGYAERQDTEDLDFLDAIAREASTRLCTDRIIGVGHSNGGMMMSRWACERDTADAVISSAGPLLLDGCTSKPTPYLAWHGTDDDIVPFDGGATEEETFPPAEDAFAILRRQNQCTDDEPDILQTDDVTCKTWSCEVPTSFCAVEGWSHRWAGVGQDRGAAPTIEDAVLDFGGLRSAIDVPEDTATDSGE